MGKALHANINIGLKWHKDCKNIVNGNQKGEINLDDLVNDEFNEESSNCKKLKKRIMSVISFMQEDYLNTMERIKCEEAIRDNEKGEMVEIVQALLNIMSRRLDHTGENA